MGADFDVLTITWPCSIAVYPPIGQEGSFRSLPDFCGEEGAQMTLRDRKTADRPDRRPLLRLRGANVMELWDFLFDDVQACTSEGAPVPFRVASSAACAEQRVGR